MTKYLDDDTDYLHNAYHKVLDQYKVEHPDLYFSSQYIKEGALDLRSYEHSRNMYSMFEELYVHHPYNVFTVTPAKWIRIVGGTDTYQRSGKGKIIST